MHPWFPHRGWIDGVLCWFHARVAFFSTELLAMVGSLLSSLLCDTFSLGLWHTYPGIAWGCPPHASLIVCTMLSLPCVCPVSLGCVVDMLLVSRWSLLVWLSTVCCCFLCRVVACMLPWPCFFLFENVFACCYLLLACSQPELLVLVGLAWIFLAGSGWFVSACQAGSAVGELWDLSRWRFLCQLRLCLAGWGSLPKFQTLCPLVPYWLSCKSVLAALLGLLWSMLPPWFSFCWCYGFHQFGWGSLPNAWATFVVLSTAALLACCFAWRKWGDLSFFSLLLSGECWMEMVLVSINTVMQVWPTGDDVRMVHYSYIADTKIWLGEALSPIALCRALFLLFPALPCWSALECWLASILWLLQPWVYWRATCGWLCAASCSLVCWTLSLVCYGLQGCWCSAGLQASVFAGWVARCYWVNAKDLFACWGFVPSAYTWGFILMVFG